MQAVARIIGRQWLHVELDVGRGDFPAGTQERTNLASAHGHGAAAGQQKFKADPEAPGQAIDFVVQGRFGCQEDCSGLEMVLEVPAHFLAVGDDTESLFCQELRGSDARTLENLGGADRSGREDDLACSPDRVLLAATFEACADSPPAIEHDPTNETAPKYGQIAARSSRRQVGGRRRAAQALAHGQVKVANTLLRWAVEVTVRRQANPPGGLDEPVTDLAVDAHLRDRQWTAGTVKRVHPMLPILGLSEEWQDIVPAPARVAELAPMLVVLRLPPQVQEAVHGTGAAHDLAPRPLDAAAIQAGVRCGPIHPVRRRIMHGHEIPDRNMEPRIPRTASGLEKGNPQGRIL